MKQNALPRKGTLVRVRARHRRGYGDKPVTVLVDGVVLGVSPKGLLLRDSHHKQARLFRAQDIIAYTPLMPNDNDGPFYRAEDMQDHIRQVGRPAVDMIRNPDPREGSW